MSTGRLVFCDPEIRKRALICSEDPERFQICSPTACYAIEINLDPDWNAASICPCNYRSRQHDADFETFVTESCCNCRNGAPPCDGTPGINDWSCFPLFETCDELRCHIKGPQTQAVPVECSFPELSPGGLITLPCIDLGQNPGINPELCCWKEGEQGLVDPACANWQPSVPCWRDPVQAPIGAASHIYGIAYLAATPPQIFIDAFELPPDETTTLIFGLFAVWQIAEPWHPCDYDSNIELVRGSCCGGACDTKTLLPASCPPGVLHVPPLGYVMSEEEADCCSIALGCCGDPTTNPPTFDPNCRCLGCKKIPYCDIWNCWINCAPTTSDSPCDGLTYPPIGFSRCRKAWKKQFYAFLVRYNQVLPDLTSSSIFDVNATVNAKTYFLAVKLRFNSDLNRLEIVGIDNNPNSDNPMPPPQPGPISVVDCSRENMVTFGCSLCTSQGLTDCGCNRCDPCSSFNIAEGGGGCCLLRGTLIAPGCQGAGSGGLNCGCTNTYQQSFRTQYVLRPDDPSQPGFSPGFFKLEKVAEYRNLGLGPTCDPSCPPIRYNCGQPVSVTVIKASLQIKNPTGF